LEKEITKLMEDEEIGNQKGIYDYILTRNERSLNLRTFDDKTKRRIYEKQKGICPHCKGENKNKKWKFEEMEGDHKDLWSEGGKTIPENCQMLCKDCHREKSGK
jgi:5-methylcytosine-specific restriction endonuclease McrA